MVVKVTLLREALAADATNIWFLPCMSPGMGFEVTLLTESFRADGALKWLFTRVHSFVVVEVQLQSKCLRTELTLKEIPGVDPHVVVQVCLLAERLATL